MRQPSGHRYILACVASTGPAYTALDIFIENTTLNDDIVLNRLKAAISVCAKRNMLDKLRPMTDAGEHLRAREHELDGAFDQSRGKRSDIAMRPKLQFATEGSTDER